MEALLGGPAEPVEQIGAWLYRVARNRIVDRFRRKKPEGALRFEDLLPSPGADRSVLLDELDAALEELPAGGIGLRVISFWQALGILVLSKILFGGFRGHWSAKNSGRAWPPAAAIWSEFSARVS